MIRKFKGINKQYNSWVFGESVFTPGINYVYINHHLTLIDVIENTVSQYIGVEDSEGNEIYENDIVEYTLAHRIDNGEVVTETYARGTVFFNYETLAFCLRVIQDNKTYICSFADLLEGNFKLKVVGNIFDSVS